MKRKIPFELYNPKLSVKENAEILNCSIASVRKFIQENKIDLRHDSAYTKWKNITQCISQHNDWSIKQISGELGYSIATIYKYKDMQKDDILQNKKDDKHSYFYTDNKNIIKSISYSQDEILSWIMRLYNKNAPFECDLTASKCIFWKRLPKPKNLFDINPQIDGVKPLSEAYNLPKENFQSIVFDLPFIVSTMNDTFIKERFTIFSNLEELHKANIDLLELSHKLLKKNGILVVKTMDIAKMGKNEWVSLFVIKHAIKLGFSLLDNFILLATHRLITHSEQQLTSRKYHSYFLVFKKTTIPNT